MASTEEDWTEIIPWMSADLPAKRKPRGADASAVKGQPTMDTFVVSDSRAEEDTWEPGDTDIVMNEDESSSGCQLTVTKELSLYERTPQPAEYFTDIVVHPSGKIAIASCYKGKLRVIKLKAGHHEEDFDVVLRELNLLGLEFLPLSDDDYAIAILHLDYRERVQLLAREFSLEDLELSSSPSTILSSTAISEKLVQESDSINLRLVSIPSQQSEAEDAEEFLGGMLVVGAQKLLLYELSDVRARAKQTSKRRRLDSKKKSTDAAEFAMAEAKESEREGRVRKGLGSVDWPWSQVTAVCAADPLVPRYIIGDIFGRLALLSLMSVKETGLILIPLGEASPASSLTYLASQTIYLGSHYGDSQLLQLSPTAVSSLDTPTLPIPSDVKTISPARLGRPSASKGKARATSDEDNTKGAVVESKGSFINVIGTFKNIAPIVDAIVVDTDGSGEVRSLISRVELELIFLQRQVVTCSGGGNRGSLNVVRNGAGFEELASVPGLMDVVNVWSIRGEVDGMLDTHLLISTLEATHLLRFNDGSGDTFLTYVKDTGLSINDGLATDVPTLAFGNIPLSQKVVQVTKKGVCLLEYDTISRTYHGIGGYKHEKGEVVAADVNGSQVFLAYRDGSTRIVGLVIEDRGFTNKVIEGDRKENPFPEISAISCAPLDPAKPYSKHLVVSYWETKTIEVFTFNLNGLVFSAKTPCLPASVRSVLLYDFSAKGEDHRYYLLAGLTDGSVACFSWKDKQLGDMKIIPLGHIPVTLTACQVDDKRAVFAAGNRATVLSWEKKRLHSSPIMMRDVVAVATLNTASYRSSLVLATSTALFIGRVEELDKMHIRTISLGLDNPTKIVYERSLKAFGVGIYRTEPNRICDMNFIQSSFRLLDYTTFNTLANFNCLPEERLSAVATYSPEIDGVPKPVFCLGVFKDTFEIEPNEGRLLILSAIPPSKPERLQRSTAQKSKADPQWPWQLYLIAAADVKGCVYAISFIKDVVVATVNSSVMAFKLKKSDDSFVFELLSEWNHNYMLTSLATYDNRIVIGDQLNSVSLLEIADGKIRNVARDYGPRWPVAVEAADKDTILAANVSIPRRKFLILSTGPVNSESSKNVGMEASHTFFTASGRIGVIVDVAEPTLSLHLTALQRNLAGVVSGVGGESHARFRAPKSNKGRSDADSAAFGFIDGDFVEQFLAFLGSKDDVEKIMAGQSDPEKLAIPVEEIQAVLENLQSFH
ncbi:hypothetical protein H0H87_004602 [Tephrocybe sp. NHM501043]|nr:hypothetical protein H0H87_004602 [Tephrocybe sp. NHM501043]